MQYDNFDTLKKGTILRRPVVWEQRYNLSMAGHGSGKKGFAHPSEAYSLSLSLADPQPQDKNLRDYAATLRVPGGNIWTGTLEENRRLAKKTKGGWRLKGDIKKTIWMVPDSVVGKE